MSDDQKPEIEQPEEETDVEPGVETVTESDDPKVAAVIRDHVEGRYPSDHFPYIADVAFRDSPGAEAGPDSVIVVRDSCS